MSFVKYIAPDGEDWRAEAAEKLLSDFGIPMAEGRAQMPRWHKAFCDQEGFAILCRLYAVNPMLGMEDPDLYRAWTAQEIATHQGMRTREVETLMEDAIKFWGRWSKGHARTEAAVPEAPRERGELEITKMLLENGFVEIKRDSERKYIAGRVDELAPWLESEQSRAVARSLIHQEVAMFFILNPAVAACRDNIESKKAKEHDSTKDSEHLMKLLKECREQQAGIDSTMKQLGMDEARNSTTKKKMAFKDVIGTLMDAVAKYYSDGDHELVDFIRTAAEIELETKPLTLRPQQYRPDVTVACWEAMQHFWERDYVPTPVARMAQRRLRAGFEQGLALIRSENGETMQSMGETGDDAEAMVTDDAGQGVQYQPVKLAVEPSVPRPSSQHGGGGNLEV